jgi:hypothetical protein
MAADCMLVGLAGLLRADFDDSATVQLCRFTAERRRGQEVRIEDGARRAQRAATAAAA